MILTHNSTLGLDIARCAAIKHDMAAVVFAGNVPHRDHHASAVGRGGRATAAHAQGGTMRDEDWQRLAVTMGRLDAHFVHRRLAEHVADADPGEAAG